MSEFLIIFDDIIATKKEGVIYIDDIAFANKQKLR